MRETVLVFIDELTPIFILISSNCPQTLPFFQQLAFSRPVPIIAVSHFS
jgi:hypothetical protein